MSARELLQAEVWSKETSWRILRWIGVVLGLFLVCFIGWYEVEVHWITPGERDTARAALKEIDELEDASSLSQQEREARTKRAEDRVKLASEAARTYRDNFIQMKLGLYLVGVEMERDKLHGKESPLIQSTLSDLKSNHRFALHKALD